nr:uncharacterized protein C15orf61 homolog isoform X3 [Bactrocera oleae]
MRLSAYLMKPKASELLTAYLKQCNEPPWTSYFVKFRDVENDQRGCYPYMKYHCSKRAIQDLSMEDKFFRFLKVINLGLPMLFYGLAAIHLISHTELVHLPNGDRVPIYFLYAEDKGSMH